MPPVKITESQINYAKPQEKPYKLRVGGALFVLVHPNGSKYFRYNYRFMGKQKTLSLGVFPQTSLKEAVEARDKAKSQLYEGIDPGTEKQEKAKNKLKPVSLKAQFRIDLSDNGKLTIETDKQVIQLLREH